MYVASTEGCNILETFEQKDFVDQGGTVKPRDRFTGGSGKNPERRHGSLKAIDPTTGETKAALKLTYPNYAGALATAGNLVFLGHYTAHSQPMTPGHSRKCGASTSAPAPTRRPSPSQSTVSNTSRSWPALLCATKCSVPRRSCGTMRRRQCCSYSSCSGEGAKARPIGREEWRQDTPPRLPDCSVRTHGTTDRIRPIARPARFGSLGKALTSTCNTALLDRGKHHGSAWVRFAEPKSDCPDQFGSIPFALIASAHLLISLTRNPRR